MKSFSRVADPKLFEKFSEVFEKIEKKSEKFQLKKCSRIFSVEKFFQLKKCSRNFSVDMDPDELAPNETFKAHLTKICLTGRARGVVFG